MPLRSAELLSVALFPGKKRVSTKGEVMRLYGRGTRTPTGRHRDRRRNRASLRPPTTRKRSQADGGMPLRAAGRIRRYWTRAGRLRSPARRASPPLAPPVVPRRSAPLTKLRGSSSAPKARPPRERHLGGPSPPCGAAPRPGRPSPLRRRTRDQGPRARAPGRPYQPTPRPTMVTHRSPPCGCLPPGSFTTGNIVSSSVLFPERCRRGVRPLHSRPRDTLRSYLTPQGEIARFNQVPFSLEPAS